MLRSDACRLAISSAAEIPLPLMSASAMPRRVGAEANEIVIVAADRASGAADRGELQPGQFAAASAETAAPALRGRSRVRFPGAGAGAVPGSARRRSGHLVERFAERAELIVLVDAHAMGEIAAADAERGVVEIADGAGDRARENDAGNERDHFEHEKYDARENQKADEQRARLRRRTSAGDD